MSLQCVHRLSGDIRMGADNNLQAETLLGRLCAMVGQRR
jgi:hypothetical protein